MNPDGISYLDIATEALRTGPLALINSYWSPLYPALIAFWEWLCRPSPFQQFAYIHALNAVIYAVMAICFAYFLRELLRFRSSTVGSFRQEVVFVAFGFAIFFRFMNTDITSFAVTPDLLVAACAFLLAGLFFRICRGQAGRGTFVGLGAIIALGYSAKAAMLPAGFAFLCILFLCSPRSRLHRKDLWIAFGAACLLCTPQILLVSEQVGHFSISESGRMNYLWWLDGLPLRGWTGTPGGDTPLHGPRVIDENPKIIEFGTPIHGTYPLWYNPSYWYAGAKVRFDLKRQLGLIKNSARFYHAIFGRLRLPLEGLVVLLILAYVGRIIPGRRELLVLLWPIAILSMYAIVVTEYRYVAPFLVIFWIVVYSAVLRQVGQVERILLALLASLMLVFSLRETFLPGRPLLMSNEPDAPVASVWIPISPAVSPERIAAQKLIAMGIRAGDPIAIVGYPYLHFYPPIARVHVIAEVVDAPAFWSLPPEAAANAEQKISKTGAKVLMAKYKPQEFQAGLWQNIPGTQYSVLKLRR